MPLVELRNLTKIYYAGEHPIRALSNVFLSINEGEFVAIIGKSGSGKSTLMNLLGCLDLPDAGEYLLEGEDVSRIPEETLARIRNRRIGFIFQGFNLIPSLNALENVELPLMYRGIRSRERYELAYSALSRVGIADRVRHRPSELSGGQQQRVAIARAIAASPPILLADEPTGNLDSASGSEVMSILKGLHDEGKTVILITHDNTIAAMAQRIIRIVDGCIVEDSVS